MNATVLKWKKLCTGTIDMLQNENRFSVHALPKKAVGLGIVFY